jgi:type I restriction enzyme S subunit
MKAVALRDLAAPKGLVGGPFGSSLGGSDYVDEGIPVIRGANLGHGPTVIGPYVHVTKRKFDADLSRNTASPGDLVFTQRGTLGQVAIVPAGEHAVFVISQSQMRLRVDGSIALPEYILYACSTVDFQRQIADRAITTGVPHINLGILAELSVPFKSLAEQRAIGGLLGALDDKIAANTKLTNVTESLISARHQFALRAPGGVAVPLLDAFRVDLGEPFKGALFTEAYSERLKK